MPLAPALAPPIVVAAPPELLIKVVPTTVNPATVNVPLAIVAPPLKVASPVKVDVRTNGKSS